MASGAAAARRPVPRAGTRPRTELVVVSSRRVVGRTPFVLLVGGLMLGGLVALLLLHTLAAQDAFHQTSLQQRLAALTDAEQHLEQQVQLDSAPAALQARAKALGMVPSVVTGYHRLADGRVVAREVAANTAAAAAAAAAGSSAASPSTAAAPRPAAVSTKATPTAKPRGTAAGAKPHPTRTAASRTAAQPQQSTSPTRAKQGTPRR